MSGPRPVRRQAEMVVVGGGLAGWIAAVEGQEQGARVTLVERAGRRPGWGNSMISGGALHAGLRSPYAPVAELLARADEITDGAADPLVAAAWARGIPETLRWIDAHGGQLVRDGDEAHRAAVLAPVRRTEPGLSYGGMGVPRFLAELARRFMAAGGQLLQPARAHRLRRGHGSRWELNTRLADHEQCLQADTVVLADGGFQAGSQLIRQHLGLGVVRLRAGANSTGDGLRMGRSVGAAVCHMAGFYGHLLAREALHDRRPWPYPVLDGLATAGVVVDRAGRRLVDEAHSGVATTNAVARAQADGGLCWLVVDSIAWETVGRAADTPPNPYLLDSGVPVVRAVSIAEVAKTTGTDAATLAESIRQVGEDPRAARPPRSAGVGVASAPFYAISVVAGVSFTLGGLRVDGEARVLDTEDEALPGLYAAGGTMGGLHGGPRDGYLGELLEAAVFGRIAGRQAASNES